MHGSTRRRSAIGVLLLAAVACGDSDAGADANRLPAAVPLPSPSAGACAFELPPTAATTVDNESCPDGVFHGDVTLHEAADRCRLWLASSTSRPYRC